ncbi:MAG: MMPL family transporter [Desulfovibrionaceae bacterium]
MPEPRRLRLLEALARFVCRRPLTVLALAALLAGTSLWITAERLRYLPDRNDLLGPDLEWNRRYAEYLNKFTGMDDLVVCVAVPNGTQATPEDRARARSYVDALVAELGRAEHVRQAYWGWDNAQVSPRLLRMAPQTRFRAALQQLERSGPLLASSNPSGFLTSVAQRLEQRETGEGTPDVERAAQGLAGVGAFVEALTGFVAGTGGDTDAAMAALLGRDFGRTYLESPDQSLLLVFVDPLPSADADDVFSLAVSETRLALRAAAREVPGVDAGVTGVPALEADETLAVMSDTTSISFLALAGVALLLVLAFHGWRMPLLAVLALLAPVAWSFGFLTLAVGHLQVLSVVFTVILLGMGIDFSIHLLSRFELVRHDHAPGPEGMEEAMADAFRTTGPGLVTGALTTAAAFGATALTDFKGIAEMGLIAGVGILLCLAGTFTVLPALVRLFLPRAEQVRPVDRRWLDLHEFRPLRFFTRHSVLTVMAGALVLAAGIWALSGERYDSNLLKLMPQNTESVRWLTRYQDAGESVWFAASVCADQEEARQRAEAFQALPEVGLVTGAGLLFPEDDSGRRMALEAVGISLSDALRVETGADSVFDFQEAVATLARACERALLNESGLPMPVAAALYELLSRCEAAQALLDEVLLDSSMRGGPALAERMDRAAEAFGRGVSSFRERVRMALDPAALTPQDLPPFLQRLALGEKGAMQLLVKPAGNAYDPDVLAAFVRAVRSVDPLATGSVVQVFESNDLMRHSYAQAALYALLAVGLLLLADFRSLPDTLLCLLPVFMGLACLCLAMRLAGYSLNPANVVILPLLFGLGVDNGVHMIHRYREDPDGDPPGLTRGTGKGVLLTSLTTILGFGVMVGANHQGIASLGFAFSSGMAFTLGACLIFLPALLRLRRKRR